MSSFSKPPATHGGAQLCPLSGVRAHSPPRCPRKASVDSSARGHHREPCQTRDAAVSFDFWQIGETRVWFEIGYIGHFYESIFTNP